MEVKYEPVFGDQSLFDGAPEDVVIAIKDVLSTKKVYYFSKNGWIKNNNGRRLDCDVHQIAMRRIEEAPEPKRWTVEDQKAGRLPEVGAKLIYTETWDAFEFVGVIAGSMRWACKDFQDGFLYFFEQSEMSPIESQEEKAARLREEWKNNVIEIHHGKRRKMSTSTFLLDDIYDALLTGELKAPEVE